MKHLLKLRKWLAELLYPINLVDLTRARLGPVRNAVEFDVEALGLEQREEALTFAENVWANPVFHKLIEKLKYDQIDHIAREARDMDQVNFARASLNGIELVEEEFTRLSVLFRERRVKAEFNKFDVM